MKSAFRPALAHFHVTVVSVRLVQNRNIREHKFPHRVRTVFVVFEFINYVTKITFCFLHVTSLERVETDLVAGFDLAAALNAQHNECAKSKNYQDRGEYDDEFNIQPFASHSILSVRI